MTVGHGPGKWKRDPDPDADLFDDPNPVPVPPHWGGLDYLAASSDPRVVAVVLARTTVRHGSEGWLRFLLADLADHGIPATEGQARALLDAVAAWDEADEVACVDVGLESRWQAHVARLSAELIAAVTAIVGEQP